MRIVNCDIIFNGCTFNDGGSNGDHFFNCFAHNNIGNNFYNVHYVHYVYDFYDFNDDNDFNNDNDDCASKYHFL